jgi:hypothetical protein
VQVACDVAGFAEGQGRGFGVVHEGQVPGVVEQAVSEVIRGAQLAQATDRRGEGGRYGRVAVAGGEAGAGKVAFGPQHRGQVPELAGVEQGEQLAGGGCVVQVIGGSRGQRPRPPYGFVADPEGADVGWRRAAAVKPSTRLISA